MPLAPIDDKGTKLWYEDSGRPWACPKYTTLVLIHGGVFHGGEECSELFECLTLTCIQRFSNH